MILTGLKHSCPRPFEWCEIHPDGSVFLCCPAWLKRPIGNLLHQSAAEIWNSPQAIEIRKTILNRSYHNCSHKTCPRLNNADSKAVESASNLAAEAIAAQQSRLEYLPPRLNLCFDYSCNLACPSCRTGHHRSSATDRQQAEQLSDLIQEQLLPAAQQLTLSGYGDPFASAIYFNLLKKIDRKSCPELKEVRLHSNGLLFDENHWQQLPELHGLLAAVEISVDAGRAETYALNRGADFSQLLNNLEYVAGLGGPLRLSMVVQQNNFPEIELLHRIAQKLGAELYLSRLVNWGTFRREEYTSRNISDQHHPQHLELLRILKRLENETGIDFGNLAQLLTS